MLKTSKIVIIGAGAAGIAAASRLLQEGLNDFVILEANNRIGGRIHTVDFADNVVDLGAQWVHGESGNVVFDLASKHNLLGSFARIYDNGKHLFCTIKGETIPMEESTKALLIYENITNLAPEELKKQKGSYGDYFTREFYKSFDRTPFTSRTRAAEFLSWIEKFQNSIDCSDTWFDVSAKKLAEYWHCEGDPVLNWKDRGYKTLFDLLLQKIPDVEKCLPVMQKIEFGKVVTNVDYASGEDVIVMTRDGCKYSASHVIFTGSLGVLKEKHSTMFVPSLPQKKQRAIKGLNIGTANKVFLEFSHTWWPEDTTFNLIWPEKEKIEFLKSSGQDSEWLCDVFSFYTVDYQPNVLCAWIVGKNARYMESLSDINVLNGLHMLLEKSLGKQYDVVKPVKMLRSKWHTDEHFRGSYTFQSIISEELNVQPKDLAEPIIIDGNKPVILFAGEATHDHYYSTVHGAVETGFREADRLINFERTRNCLNQLLNNFDESEPVANGTSPITEKTKVVIVGAGIAGLAAAKTLQDAHFTDYLLLEAQNKIGGRIHSIPWENGWIDCGAQFLHGDKSKLAQYCLNNDLLSKIEGTDGKGIFLREDGTVVNDDLVNEVDDFVRTILEECETYQNKDFQKTLGKHENIGSILRSRFEKYIYEKNDFSIKKRIKEEIFDWNVRFLLIDNCCHSLNDLSAMMWGMFKYAGGRDHLLFKSGYNSLTKLLLNDLNKKNLRLDTPVESIYWHDSVRSDEDSSIIVTTSKGRQIYTDAIIITCSLGYLKENHEKMFDPPLPINLRGAIKNLGFGSINKIFLDFGKPWWSAGTKGFQLIWNKDGNHCLPVWTRDLTGFDVLPDHQSILLGWIGGQGAYIVEGLSEQVIAQDCVNLLRHCLRCPDLPSVKRCARTNWNGNKYIRGGYSHITKSCEENKITPRTLAEPVWATVSRNNTQETVPIIMFAGEATHDNFYSTTHGAYDTGIYQAELCLEYHGQKRSAAI